MRACLTTILAVSICCFADRCWAIDPAVTNPVTSNESPTQVQLLKQAREDQANNSATNPTFTEKVGAWFRAHQPFSSAATVNANESAAQKNLINQANKTTVDQKSKTDGAPTLKDTLEKGLKARQPEEFSFVRKVVRMVDTGRLPRSVVQSTFLWARDKDHPFQYFQMGLTLRAQKMGISM
jgi:hypothetical protein